MASEWRIFTNKVDSSNKYWSFRYTGSGSSVEKKWGRIGGHEDTQTKEFGSSSRALSYAESEVAKKLAKGYTEQTQEILAEETKIAQALGSEYKITRIEFLSQPFDPNKSTDKLMTSSEYAPEYGVYVEILQSWTKDTYHVLMNKKQAVQYRAGSVTKGAVSHVNVNTPTSPNYSFVEGIRLAIRNIYKAVEEVAVQFAAVGFRTLELDDDDLLADAPGKPKNATVVALKAVAARTGASSQVLHQFCALGHRTLEI